MTKESTDSTPSLVIGSPDSASSDVAGKDILQNENDFMKSIKKQNDSLPENMWKLSLEDDSVDETVKTLATGIVTYYESDLKSIQKSLAELTETQKILIETVQQENVRFSEIRNQCVLDEVLNKTKQYHMKLVQIKKDMAAVYELSTKLKKRSLRLQEQKQKEALQRELLRERQAERDKQILAKTSCNLADKTDNLSPQATSN